VTDPWRAEVPIPGWVRSAAIPTLSFSALLAGVWFLHDQFVWPYFEQFRMLADLHCQADHLGWAGSWIVAATCQSAAVHDYSAMAGVRWVNLVAMPAVAYACVVATWAVGIRSIGWIAGGCAALLTSMSPLLFVAAHAVSPDSLLPIAVACTLICAECAARAAGSKAPRVLWLVATLCGALVIAGLDVRAGLIGVAALCHSVWRGASPNARAWVATASAAFALVCAYLPTADWSTAVVRAGARALPLDVIGFGFPDTWRILPFFGDWFGVSMLALLVGGAWVGRASVLPLAVAAVFAQCALLAASAWSPTSVLSLLYAVVIVGLCVGAVTQWLARRSPHSLALVPPALAVAAFVVTYQTLGITYDFDPADRSPGGPFAFDIGSSARLYHERGRADVATVYNGTDALWANARGVDRGRFLEPANAAVVVVGTVVMSEYRALTYGYSVRSRDGLWSGLVPAQELWLEPTVGQCVRPLTGKGIRLYDKQDVPFRTSDDGQVISDELSVLDVRDAAWLPELHVRVQSTSTRPQTGWIYVQTLQLWDPDSPSRANGFTCESARRASP